MSIRSGHFSFNVPKRAAENTPFGTADRRLSFGGGGTIVRVFNSTERFQYDQKYFRVEKKLADGAAAAVEVDQNLYPTMSIDFVVVSNGSIENTGINVVGQNGVVGMGNSLFEGSYDLLRTADGTLMNERRRSGRFNFPAAVPDRLPHYDPATGKDGTAPLFPVLLADLTNLADGSVMYRIQNTGENTFDLTVADNRAQASGMAHHWESLDKAQGIDIAVPAGKSLFVKRSDGQAASIRGVYEIVG